MKKWVVLLIVVVVILLAFGCSLVTIVKDDLPPGVPKGYVEFYRSREDSQKLQQGNVAPLVYSVDKTTEKTDWEKEEGKVLFANAFKSRGTLRIAKMPGVHRFRVELGDVDRGIQVNVPEGMVVPVRIIISDISSEVTTSPSYRGTYSMTTTTRFKMSITVEEPVPFIK